MSKEDIDRWRTAVDTERDLIQWAMSEHNYEGARRAALLLLKYVDKLREFDTTQSQEVAQ